VQHRIHGPEIVIGRINLVSQGIQMVSQGIQMVSQGIQMVSHVSGHILNMAPKNLQFLALCVNSLPPAINFSLKVGTEMNQIRWPHDFTHRAQDKTV
jgi:hypothetical protein